MQDTSAPHPTRLALMAIVFVIALTGPIFAAAPAALARNHRTAGQENELAAADRDGMPVGLRGLVLPQGHATEAPDIEPLGTLAIHKVETGDTAPGGTYRFNILGPDHFVYDVDIAAGETWTIDLPFGEYFVEEVDAPVGHTIAPNPAILDAEGVTVTVTATNPYRDFRGRLAITKVVTGDLVPDRDYTFDIVGPDEMAFTTDPIPAGTTWTSDWLPLGSYTVTERDDPVGATISPDPAVLDADGETVTVIATNPYPTFHAGIAIHKVETGDTAPSTSTHFPPDHDFEIAGPDGLLLPVSVAAGETVTIDPLPLGTYTITELGHADVTYSPGDVVVLDQPDQLVTVTATNHYRDFRGKLAITMVELGGVDPPGTYALDITGPSSFTTTVEGGDTWTSDWLPLGTYTIAQRDAVDGATIAPNPATLLVDGATVTIVITNPVVLSGSGALPATGNPVLAVTSIALALIAAGAGLLLLVHRDGTRTRR